jgi:hypothetical protein
VKITIDSRGSVYSKPLLKDKENPLDMARSGSCGLLTDISEVLFPYLHPCSTVMQRSTSLKYKPATYRQGLRRFGRVENDKIVYSYTTADRRALTKLRTTVEQQISLFAKSDRSPFHAS